VRISDVAADRGGALFVGGRGFLRVTESEIRKSDARVGGALAVEDAGRVAIEALTIAKARARASAGGQAIHVKGSKLGRPSLLLKRVKLEDVPMGLPVVIDAAWPGEITVASSDMPRVVASAQGVVDAGGNRWR
jgi:hypothetical protein